jgi:hypothetical protein
MKHYKRKNAVEALQWTKAEGGTTEDVFKAFGKENFSYNGIENALYIHHWRGIIKVQINDFIFWTNEGEIGVCAPAPFLHQHEALDKQ